MFPATGRASPASLPMKEAGGCDGSFPGPAKGSKTSKVANVVEEKDCIPTVYGTSLPLNSFSHRTTGTCGLESDYSTTKKNSLPEDKVATGGVFANTFHKDHYKAAVEQLAVLNLSNSTRTAQHNSNSNKQGSLHSWSSTHDQGNNSVSRNVNKPFIQMPSNSSNLPTNFVHTNPLVHSFMKRCYPASSSGTQKRTSERSCRNGNGDFCKKGSGTTASGSYPATDSSDDMPSTLKRRMKLGNGNVEDTLPLEEKATSESEKRSRALLKRLKNVNTNLKPEPIEHKESVSSSLANDTFSYPDFLPPPYNNLDLQKLSKLDNWRLALNEPVDEPVDKLVSRLVEMERLQHATILKERVREAVSPTVAVNNPSSSKDVHQLKHPRSSDLSGSQGAFDGNIHNFGSYMHGRDIPKCTSQHCHNKWNSGESSPALSSTKHSRACCNISKCCKVPVAVDTSNIVTQRSPSCSGSSPKIQTGVNITSPKLSSSSTTVGCSLPDNASSKYKQAKTKRKSSRKNGAVMGKPINC